MGDLYINPPSIFFLVPPLLSVGKCSYSNVIIPFLLVAIITVHSNYLNSLNFRAHLIFAHLIFAYLIFAHLQKSQFRAHPIFAHCQKRIKERVEKMRHNIHNIRSFILYKFFFLYAFFSQVRNIPERIILISITGLRWREYTHKHLTYNRYQSH